MIDWNKRNGGFLSPESVYEDQLGNLSQQINKKDKEIEELNDLLHKANDEVVSYADECIRLNNIINELEVTLKNLIIESNNLNHKLTAKIILMRLQELKEKSDKE